jgi:hypothetical protein
MKDANVDSVWYIYRPGQPLIDPDSNTTLGFEATYLGTARVVRGGEPGIIVLTSVTQEVGIGDKLVAAGKPEMRSYVPRAPSTPVQGRIIALYGRDTRVGEYGNQSVIAINLGKSQGIEFGNVVALYRPGEVIAEGSRPLGRSTLNAAQPITLPNARYGTAFVFRVFDRVSYALVVYITRPVNKLDLVQNP